MKEGDWFVKKINLAAVPSSIYARSQAEVFYFSGFVSYHHRLPSVMPLWLKQNESLQPAFRLFGVCLKS